MIRINLLPYRAARKKENIRFQVNVYLGSIFLVGLAIFWYNLALSNSIKGLQTKIQDTKDQVAKYEKINQEIAEIKNNLAVLEKKIEVIESLERDRKAPVQNLDSLYHLLVEKRMWYTKIEEKGTAFEVDGVAVDNQTVADYMTRVESSERFEQVKLAAVKQVTIKDQGLDLKEFNVRFNKKDLKKDSEKDSKTDKNKKAKGKK